MMTGNATGRHRFCSAFWLGCKVSFAIVLVIFLFVPSAYADKTDSALVNTSFDQTSVCVKVQGLGDKEIPAVIRNNELYLPVIYFFNFLKIKNIVSPDSATVSGFIVNAKNTFVINSGANYIQYRGSQFGIAPYDLIQADNDLYLKLDYYINIFLFECRFEFDNLSVNINTLLDLPAIREKKIEAIHNNIKYLKGEQTVDTVIAYKDPFFHFGMADWSVVNTNQLNGPNDLRFGLNFGTNIAGTEAVVGLNYFSQAAFNEKRQYYLWRYANNNNKFLRQVTAGRIPMNAISSIYSPVIGLQFSNAPTRLRQNFGKYHLSDYTEPGWIVEVYINNILVDYTKADAAGFFSFDIPLIYGNTIIRLQFYGPWGEEYSRQKNINIPFSLLPQNEFEYTISGAMVEDGKHSLFARAGFNYGITQNITAGGGVEYLSAIDSNKFMPYINSSIRLTPNLLLAGEFTNGVRTKGALNYRFRSNASFEAYYTKYARDQKAIIFNYLEDRKVLLSIPFRRRSLSGLARLAVSQIILSNKSSYLNAECLLATSFNRVSINLNNYLVSSPKGERSSYYQYIYSDLSLAIKMTNRLLFMPQLQYAYRDNEFISMKYRFEYGISPYCFMNLSYERNFISNIYSTSLGLRCNLSFVHGGATLRQFNNTYSITSFAHGSFIYDNKTQYYKPVAINSVRTGGATFLPYLDLNGNKVKDAGEPKVEGQLVNVKGGRVVYDDKDTVARVLHLEPYVTYHVDLNRNNFSNIAWQTAYNTIGINVKPNQLQLIEIPVEVRTEISGYINIDSSSLRAKKGIRICFYSANGNMAGVAYTEDDGFFSYTGLPPGSYRATVDPQQLQGLKLRIFPEYISFVIQAGAEGAIIDNIILTLRDDL